MSQSKGFVYPYARPAVMVDAVVFGLGAKGLQLILIRRKSAPYKGRWALPGGHVEAQETVEQAVLRELGEETGVGGVFFQQLHTFSGPKRDPREPTVSVAFYVLLDPDNFTRWKELKAGSDAKEARWFDITELPALAFDHHEILQMAVDRVREQILYKPLAFEFLPNEFTIGQLREVYERTLGVEIHKSNFRRDVIKSGVLEELPERMTQVANRPPRLYRYSRQNKSGFPFKPPV